MAERKTGKRNGKTLPIQLIKANEIRDKKTAENKALFLEAYASKANNISMTCKAIGIGRTTFHDWYREDKEFRQAVDDAKEGMLDLAETMLMSEIKNGNIAAICFFLKTQGRRRGYVEHQIYEPPPAEYDLSKLTREERTQLYKLTVKATTTEGDTQAAIEAHG